MVFIFCSQFVEGIEEFPEEDCPRSYFFMQNTMTLITTGPCQYSNKCYSWNFEDGQFKYMEGLDTIASNHDRAAFASQGSRHVLFSGKGKIV